MEEEQKSNKKGWKVAVLARCKWYYILVYLFVYVLFGIFAGDGREYLRNPFNILTLSIGLTSINFVYHVINSYSEDRFFWRDRVGGEILTIWMVVYFGGSFLELIVFGIIGVEDLGYYSEPRFSWEKWDIAQYVLRHLADLGLAHSSLLKFLK